MREFARRVKSAHFGRARARNVPLASAVEAVRGGVRAGVQVGVGVGAGDGVGAGAGNENGERGGSGRIMEGVNRDGNEEFEGVVCVHMNGEGVICGECEGNESFGVGNNVSDRGAVHTDGLVA